MLKTNSYFINFWVKRHLLSPISRYYSKSIDRRRICIVGSGPGGFYTAKDLVKNDLVEIDIFEKLPVPFGLIRYGVSPDHPDIKFVTKKYTEIALHERCNFYGNINVGEDVRVSELLDSYHAVVLAVGASFDKTIGIPGEDSKNVLAARRFVGWFNGHPDFVNESIDLDTEVAVIVGNGNVAIDVARILLTRVEDLKATDIAEYAYETLKHSRIKKVIMVARRSPLQAAFSMKELREMIELPGCRIDLQSNILPSILKAKENGSLQIERKVRLVDFMGKIQNGKIKFAQGVAERCLKLQFLRNPKQIIPDNNGRVEKFHFNVVQAKVSIHIDVHLSRLQEL